jgi:hypothetical protein
MIAGSVPETRAAENGNPVGKPSFAPVLPSDRRPALDSAAAFTETTVRPEGQMLHSRPEIVVTNLVPDRPTRVTPEANGAARDPSPSAANELQRESPAMSANAAMLEAVTVIRADRTVNVTHFEGQARSRTEFLPAPVLGAPAAGLQSGRRAAQQPTAPVAEERHVQVTIGRLEVRVAPGQTSPSRSAPSSNPGETLAQYLRSRRTGGLG